MIKTNTNIKRKRGDAGDKTRTFMNKKTQNKILATLYISTILLPSVAPITTVEASMANSKRFRQGPAVEAPKAAETPSYEETSYVGGNEEEEAEKEKVEREKEEEEERINEARRKQEELQQLINTSVTDNNSSIQNARIYILEATQKQKRQMCLQKNRVATIQDKKAIARQYSEETLHRLVSECEISEYDTMLAINKEKITSNKPLSDEDFVKAYKNLVKEDIKNLLKNKSNSDTIIGAINEERYNDITKITSSDGTVKHFGKDIPFSDENDKEFEQLDIFTKDAKGNIIKDDKEFLKNIGDALKRHNKTELNKITPLDLIAEVKKIKQSKETSVLVNDDTINTATYLGFIKEHNDIFAKKLGSFKIKDNDDESIDDLMATGLFLSEDDAKAFLEKLKHTNNNVDKALNQYVADLSSSGTNYPELIAGEGIAVFLPFVGDAIAYHARHPEAGPLDSLVGAYDEMNKAEVAINILGLGASLVTFGWGGAAVKGAFKTVKLFSKFEKTAETAEKVVQYGDKIGDAVESSKVLLGLRESDTIINSSTKLYDGLKEVERGTSTFDNINRRVRSFSPVNPYPEKIKKLDDEIKRAKNLMQSSDDWTYKFNVENLTHQQERLSKLSEMNENVKTGYKWWAKQGIAREVINENVDDDDDWTTSKDAPQNMLKKISNFAEEHNLRSK